MNCRRVQRRISLFLDDRLNPAERAEVAAHLLSCASCSSSFEELRGTLAALGILERAEPAEDGWARLLPLLEQSSHGAKRTQWLAAKPLWNGLAASAAALVAIVAGSILLLRPAPVHHTVSVPAPPTATATNAPKAVVQPAPDSMAAPPIVDTRAVAAGSKVKAGPTGPKPASRRMGATAAVASRPRAVASAVRSQIPAPTPVRFLAELEPDPELVACTPPAAEESVAKGVADLVSTGLAPLVAAAETEDPLSWITDASAEEWL